MDMKDQRIELRLPQQQLEELDNFIDSIDSQYKPSRSDVLRSFIAQGIRGKFTPAGQDAEMFPLMARLNIFFQICQQLRADNKGLQPLSRASDNLRFSIRNYKESTVTAEALVRHVYLQRFTWFYELDQAHLKAINTTLGQGTLVLSLMNPRHTPEICSVLDSVIAMRDMFARIDSVIKEAENKLEAYPDSALSNSLSRIDGYARDNGVPLRFRGYPDTADYTQQIQMWSLLNWIDIGEGSHSISESGQRHDQDLTGKYAIMLEVYRNITLNQRFDLDALEQLVKNRQFLS